MKRVLFLYKYGILGGVCTQLYHRLTAIPKNEIEVHCGFMGNHGAEDLLGGFCELHFSLDGNGMVELLEREKFDLVVIIDTEEYIQKILEMEKEIRLQRKKEIYERQEMIRKIWEVIGWVVLFLTVIN